MNVYDLSIISRWFGRTRPQGASKWTAELRAIIGGSIYQRIERNFVSFDVETQKKYFGITILIKNLIRGQRLRRTRDLSSQISAENDALHEELFEKLRVYQNLSLKVCALQNEKYELEMDLERNRDELARKSMRRESDPDDASSRNVQILRKKRFGDDSRVRDKSKKKQKKRKNAKKKQTKRVLKLDQKSEI